MTKTPELSTPVDTVEGTPSNSDQPSMKSVMLTLVIVVIAAGALVLGMNTMNAAAHPYTGSGVVKSHTPWGSALCQITVIESDGNEHLYKKTGGLPYCQGVEDGAKVEVEAGLITSITAR